MSHLANSKVRRIAAKQWPTKTINFAFITVRIGKLTVFTPLNTSLRINARSQRYSKPLKYLLKTSISQNFMRKVSLSKEKALFRKFAEAKIRTATKKLMSNKIKQQIKLA